MCAEALQGTVAAGGVCWRSLECVAGTYCDHGYTAARTCPGTCRAQLEPGRVCTVARQCLASAGRTARCEGGRCVDATDAPDAAEGAPCGAIPAGTDSVSVVGCAPGLYCEPAINGMLTCRRILRRARRARAPTAARRASRASGRRARPSRPAAA